MFELLEELISVKLTICFLFVSSVTLEYSLNCLLVMLVVRSTGSLAQTLSVEFLCDSLSMVIVSTVRDVVLISSGSWELLLLLVSVVFGLEGCWVGSEISCGIEERKLVTLEFELFLCSVVMVAICAMLEVLAFSDTVTLLPLAT